MKLIFAIINNDDSNSATAALNKEGVAVTRLSTTGGFLMTGNTTLLIGAEDNDVDKITKILKDTCAQRRHVPSSYNSLGRGMGDLGLPAEVTVGGATIFVLSVDENIKI